LDSKSLIHLGMAFSLAFILTGCNRAPGKGAASGSPLAQNFLEISIDGKRLVMPQESRDKGQLVLLAIMNNAMISMSVMDKTEDFSFSISADIKQVAPGSFKVYQCLNNDAGCGESPKNHLAVLSPYMKDHLPTGTEIKMAYQSPKLGLQPLVLTIEKIEDAFVNGIGPSKRVRGAFKGALATVLTDKQSNEYVAGPLKQIEGKFDLYAVLR
jgi:hypothetical protein